MAWPATRPRHTRNEACMKPGSLHQAGLCASTPQEWFACVAELSPGCFDELRAKLPFPDRQSW
jgi:hypothetical protein